MPAQGSSEDRSVPSTPEVVNLYISLCFLSFSTIPSFPHSQTHSSVGSQPLGLMTTTVCFLPPVPVTSPVLPAHHGQRTLPKIPLLCQPPQITTCPVKNVSGSTRSQIKCKLLSLATQASYSSLPRLSTFLSHTLGGSQDHKAAQTPDLGVGGVHSLCAPPCPLRLGKVFPSRLWPECVQVLLRQMEHGPHLHTHGPF